jgi:malonyl-CoA decarboxylase
VAVGDEHNQRHQELRQALRLTVVAYLTRARRDDGSLHDPVAEFHLANGASIEQINTFADMSERALRQSFGCMVNYRYDPDTVVANHERFVNAGTIAMSKSVARDYQRIKSVLDEAA